MHDKFLSFPMKNKNVFMFTNSKFRCKSFKDVIYSSINTLKAINVPEEVPNAMTNIWHDMFTCNSK